MASLHNRDKSHSLITGTAIIESVDIAQQNQRVGMHKACYESGELIVIGEHQLGDAHGIVLIDYRKNSVREHHFHTSAHILAMLLRVEIGLLRQHLSYGDMVLAKEIIVAVD